MKESVELKELMLRFYQAMAEGDLDAVERLVSPEALAIGSDASEWLRGPALIAMWRQQVAASGGRIPFSPGDPEAFEEGTVGWVADRPSLRFPGMDAIPFRLTMVFHREDGEWKAVQSHASVAVPNDLVQTT